MRKTSLRVSVVLIILTFFLGLGVSFAAPKIARADTLGDFIQRISLVDFVRGLFGLGDVTQPPSSIPESDGRSPDGVCPDSDAGYICSLSGTCQTPYSYALPNLSCQEGICCADPAVIGGTPTPTLTPTPNPNNCRIGCNDSQCADGEACSTEPCFPGFQKCVAPPTPLPTNTPIPSHSPTPTSPPAVCGFDNRNFQGSCVDDHTFEYRTCSSGQWTSNSIQQSCNTSLVCLGSSSQSGVANLNTLISNLCVTPPETTPIPDCTDATKYKYTCSGGALYNVDFIAADICQNGSYVGNGSVDCSTALPDCTGAVRTSSSSLPTQILINTMCSSNVTPTCNESSDNYHCSAASWPGWSTDSSYECSGIAQNCLHFDGTSLPAGGYCKASSQCTSGHCENAVCVDATPTPTTVPDQLPACSEGGVNTSCSYSTYSGWTKSSHYKGCWLWKDCLEWTGVLQPVGGYCQADSHCLSSNCATSSKTCVAALVSPTPSPTPIPDCTDATKYRYSCGPTNYTTDFIESQECVNGVYQDRGDIDCTPSLPNCSAAPHTYNQEPSASAIQLTMCKTDKQDCPDDSDHVCHANNVSGWIVDNASKKCGLTSCLVWDGNPGPAGQRCEADRQCASNNCGVDNKCASAVTPTVTLTPTPTTIVTGCTVGAKRCFDNTRQLCVSWGQTGAWQSIAVTSPNANCAFGCSDAFPRCSTDASRSVSCASEDEYSCCTSVSTTVCQGTSSCQGAGQCILPSATPTATPTPTGIACPYSPWIVCAAACGPFNCTNDGCSSGYKCVTDPTPSPTTTPEPTLPTCVSPNTCVSSAACVAGYGSDLSGQYSCSGSNVCCNFGSAPTATPTPIGPCVSSAHPSYRCVPNTTACTAGYGSTVNYSCDGSKVCCDYGTAPSNTPTPSSSPTPTSPPALPTATATPTLTPTPTPINCSSQGGFCRNTCPVGYNTVDGTECSANGGTQQCCVTSPSCQWCADPGSQPDGYVRNASADGSCQSPKVCYSAPGGGGSGCPWKQNWKCRNTATGQFTSEPTTACNASPPSCSSGSEPEKAGICYEDCPEPPADNTPTPTPPPCSPEAVTMTVTNPAIKVCGAIQLNLGGTEGATQSNNTFTGALANGIECTNSSGWPTITCTAKKPGTYTWTHTWKKCEGENCSAQCSKTATITVQAAPSVPDWVNQFLPYAFYGTGSVANLDYNCDGAASWSDYEVLRKGFSL